MFGRSIIPFSAEAHFRVVAISFFYGGWPRAHFAAALLLIQLATVNGIHESYTKQIYIPKCNQRSGGTGLIYKNHCIRPTEIFSERREVIIGNRDLTEVNPAMYYK